MDVFKTMMKLGMSKVDALQATLMVSGHSDVVYAELYNIGH